MDGVLFTGLVALRWVLTASGDNSAEVDFVGVDDKRRVRGRAPCQALWLAFVE